MISGLEMMDQYFEDQISLIHSGEVHALKTKNYFTDGAVCGFVVAMLIGYGAAANSIRVICSTGTEWIFVYAWPECKWDARLSVGRSEVAW